ncbi:ring-cleaving dioxygenase [Caldibacillus lycopersici]|uniref:Ring-cleaving dioxygenase n=1 Tax=Perspicuibacillus lycopersici TaxID=1325689 RepID=A0AAE3LM08_9BACI|nr:ring-cleaving dioxygenase [Perspicuibacillus lycopersici]MCU9613030.1 ring-cleaving dioxygenase [Perspicuibacillus lycopersici]
MRKILGQHHVSMFTKDAQTNVHFYRDTLGLRFVKKTVNQDNPFMYHLFYGDIIGSPGTELSFFELPHAGKTYRGTNSISKIGLLVESEDALNYWKQRFEELAIVHGDYTIYAGRKALPFEDPDGLSLLLINNASAATPSFWKKWEGSPVPMEYQILGIGAIELSVRYPEKTAKLLTNVFGYKEVSATEDLSVYQCVEGTAYSDIVVKKLEAVKERPGRGSVHHLAIRVADPQALQEWASFIKEQGYTATSDIIDRYYFQSFYFRERNGILFELATDGPGFPADESIESLGETLALPPFLEARRAEIEAKLTPIK